MPDRMNCGENGRFRMLGNTHSPIDSHCENLREFLYNGLEVVEKRCGVQGEMKGGRGWPKRLASVSEWPRGGEEIHSPVDEKPTVLTDFIVITAHQCAQSHSNSKVGFCLG